MFNKAMILHELGQAKIAHLRWVKRADHLISGLPVESDHIPAESTVCEFGKWFYSPLGRMLRSLYVFESTMNRMEEIHDQIHEEYAAIYHIFYDKPLQRSLLRKIVSFGEKKISKADMREAKERYETIKRHSEALTYQIEKLEKAVVQVDMVLLQRRYQTQGLSA